MRCRCQFGGRWAHPRKSERRFSWVLAHSCQRLRLLLRRQRTAADYDARVQVKCERDSRSSFVASTGTELNGDMYLAACPR